VRLDSSNPDINIDDIDVIRIKLIIHELLTDEFVLKFLNGMNYIIEMAK